MKVPTLHQDTIEEVKSRADIVDVISDHVVLRKRGKDFLGLCPFHDEKTPSFTVSPTKQMYYCFGCQAAGNSIKFLMELGKRPFAEVVLDLAKRYQIPVKTLAPEQRQELQKQISLRDQLYTILATTAQFFQHTLKQSHGKNALDYITKKRHFSEATIQQFGLGYAPAGWETLYHYLVDKKQFPVQLVEQAGLIKPRKEGGGYYDVFRDRLMIPIRDIQGRVIAFGGRTLTEEQPKYLNSPETELFNKGKILFALDAAKDNISKLDQAVVVEGYFDAIALHQAGINNVVASLGTALSIEQIRLLLRYTESKQLILNFDADKAGNNAASRAIGEVETLAYKGEVQLKILNIPHGKDADEYLQNNTAEDYKQLLIKAPLWLNWQIDKIIENKDLKQPADFQQTTQRIVKLLQNIQNQDTLNYYISHCAEILSLGDSQLIPLRVENLVTQIKPQTYKPSKPQITNQEKKPKLTIVNSEAGLLEKAEALILIIYLHDVDHRQIIMEELENRNLEFSLSHHRLLWQQIAEFSIEENDLISHIQTRYLQIDEEWRFISHLFHLNEKMKKEILRSPQVIQAALACMERVYREKRCRYFREQWEKIDPQTEPEKDKYYAEAIYIEKLHLQDLEKQRQFAITDLL
ncbi:DNA primase [Anabaena sp. FACHB-1237]|uniref:DNA primase n=1 Tax=Anabaena sp. FACHB-1237 TaxID=2692769 RepID=UPI001680E7CF|nr:DNA primase [Anabaena sp. FACHB-1237]MBD2138808.1 DNA primase [Anabaena sp. FACHB-1237]